MDFKSPEEALLALVIGLSAFIVFGFIYIGTSLFGGDPFHLVNDLMQYLGVQPKFILFGI